MKAINPTPPLSRAGRRVADAVLEGAKFRPTPDGKRLVRRFEVHGIVVTEWVNADSPLTPSPPVS